MNLATFVNRFRWHLLLLWLAGIAALWLFVKPPDSTAGLTTELLPPEAPFSKAQAAMAENFRGRSALSEAVIVFERQDGPLTDKDKADIEAVAKLLPKAGADGLAEDDLRELPVLTPGSTAMLGKHNPLVSPDGKAAFVKVSLPFNHTSTRTARIVNHIHAVLDGYQFQPGLDKRANRAVTGSAGYGRDYVLATDRSHNNILIVTLIAVVLILLAVYRAPLAALVPLIGIGMATVLATKLTVLGHGIGLSSGTPERLFMMVLLYGAGVDYSLLFISRYRENLLELRPHGEAFIRGLNASAAAILSSATMTAAGLATLYFARFGVFHDVGPAIALALVVAAIASVTVVPAMVAIIGPRLFWPRRHEVSPAVLQLVPAVSHAPVRSAAQRAICHERRWSAVARFVTRRPILVLVVTLVALAGPAWQSVSLKWGYNSQASLKSSYDAVRGVKMVERHWPSDELAPVNVLVAAPASQPDATWRSVCDKIMANVRKVEGVSNVRGFTLPLGMHVDPVAALGPIFVPGLMGMMEPIPPEKLKEMVIGKARPEYLSDDSRAIRLYVMLKTGPQTPEALEAAARIRGAVERGLAEAGLAADVHLTGPTAETCDLRDTTQSDFRRTSLLALAIIFVIVVALLRDVVLSLFMVAATVLGYAATLGLTYWAFMAVGVGGLDWEVEVFLFIVLVAVGQDYNIFFAVRLAQEGRALGPREATERALIHTGRVISSCGLIMAATLGSMLAGDVKMLQQLGFALALGMLIDTFVVRPLLLPSFIVLTQRTLDRAVGFIR